LGIAKAFRNEQNKKHDGRDDDGGKDREPPSDVANAFQDASKTVHTISENRRDQKLTARRVLAVKGIDTVADPRYLPWSEQPITFSRADQWAEIPYSGRFLLVLDTIIQKDGFDQIHGHPALHLFSAKDAGSRRSPHPAGQPRHRLRL
jgi:hypothetical protein